MIEKSSLKTPEKKYRPEVRWWLAEGFHTDETLKKEIQDLDETGFGAIEFLAMDEPGCDPSLYGWGAEEWVHDSHTVVEETTRRGMGVSMTSGTNWANANLINITPDDKAASKELDYTAATVKAGETWSGKLPECELTVPNVTKQELEAIVAIRIAGEREGKTYLDKDSSIVLTGQVKDGSLTWTAPAEGDYLLFFFWIHGTGQTAEPSVSTSYTVNYIDRYGVEAFIEYWESTVLTGSLKENIEKNGRGMMYMDSLELGTFGRGGQFWGYHFLEEFKKRRGYDLTPYLPFVLKEAGMMQRVYRYFYHCEDEVFIEKMLNDLYQTMTDLYMDNMLKPMQEWLHSHNMELRAEISYGLPFEISQPGKYVDGIETESLEFASQLESFRNLAGPAHIYGRIYSSETGATLLNYMMGLDFYTQIIYMQFAAGVSKTVLHGYSSIAGSEGSTYWPGHEGMWPIFSERFGSRQPSYQHYKDWTAMLARYQMILRQGKPRMDLGIIRLDYNFNNLIFHDIAGHEEESYKEQLGRGNKGMYWEDMQLQNAGYTWDYFAPQILEEDFVDFANGLLLPDGPGYQALLIYQDVLPLSTAEKLLKLAKKGLKILFVNGAHETLRPKGFGKTYKKAAAITPFNDGGDEKLREIIDQIKVLPNVWEIDDQKDTCKTLKEAGILPRTAFAESNKNILTNLRDDNGELYVFTYNMMYGETEALPFTLKVQGIGNPSRIDCWNGETEELGCYRYEDGATVFDVCLAPGEAAMFVIDTHGPEEVHAVRSNADKLVMKDGKLVASVSRTGEYEIELSDGTKKTFQAEVPENISLPVWNLEVEDWNEGEKKTIVEDRGLGIVTNEVYYETKKTLLPVGETRLIPWKDMEKVGPEVSGIGYYRTTVRISEDWDESQGAVLKIGSTNGHSAAVYVNGTKAKAFDFDALAVDISDLLHTGENEICVETASSLNNRLKARGYYAKGNEFSRQLADNANNAVDGSAETNENEHRDAMFNIQAVVRDYGMTGEVELIRYIRKEI